MTSLSATTIGDEAPLGAATFHFTFFSGPISTGGFCPSATPDPPGPRNRGHASRSSAPNATAANTPTANNAAHTFDAFIARSSVVAGARSGLTLTVPALAARGQFVVGRCQYRRTRPLVPFRWRGLGSYD